MNPIAITLIIISIFYLIQDILEYINYKKENDNV